MLALFLFGSAALCGEVPVLLDPAGARAGAADTADGVGPDGLLAVAETQLLAGAAADALTTLERLELEIETPEIRARRIRIALDAEIALRDPDRARPLAEALIAIPEWRIHGLRQQGEINRLDVRASIARLGGSFFALALALMMIGGARELIRIHRRMVYFSAACGAGVVLVLLSSPLLGRILALVALAWVALAHAAEATVARTEPVPRARGWITATFAIGALGAAMAVFGAVDAGFLIEHLG